MDISAIDLTRKLPIGIQTFERIRKEGYLYVDKSALMWQIANTGSVYFLSRPRRFGKSLLLSTFESYFQGRKDLFEGLAIEKWEKEWNTYPVLHLDLNAEKYDSAERLVDIIDRQLRKWETFYSSNSTSETLSGRFMDVIHRAYEQTGRGVVILIDEYDKPLLQTMFNEPLAEEYRNILKAFYAVLKSSDRYLRFVLLTGVTKFSHVSIFSDLNQLNDISMDMRYSAVCGITEEELVATFTPEIKQMSLSNNLSFEETVAYMKAQYDGYHFSANSPGMFNPFSVLNSFYKQQFENYWFQTGTPTFLVELLKRSDYDLRELIDGVETSSDIFMQYRVEANNPIPVFYQSGYLTIKGYESRLNMYLLKFPNNEVEYAFLRFLVQFNAETRNIGEYLVRGN
ncbi:AAA family ATPase [Bacteroides sp. 224]|nr:AAA family ATPase [Bacteroides sp. 224]